MRTMIQPRKWGAIVLALALVLAAVPVSASQTQTFDPDFYVSELTGFEIEVSGPAYEIVDAELQHYPTGEGEIVSFGSESVVSTLEVSFFDDADTPQETVDIYLQSMENAAEELDVLDRGINGDVHYALAAILFEGVDIVYYLQVEEDVQGNVDLFQSILSTPDLLEADLQDAQTEVTIDGDPFMDTVDATELANVVAEGGSLAEPGVEATPSATGDTYTFSDSDTAVSVGDDFEFLGEPEQRTDVELVRIEGPGTLSMVAVGQTGSSPEVVLNSFSSGIGTSYADTENVDEEIGDDYAWRLLSIPKDLEASTFMLITVDTSTAPGFEIMQAHEVPSDGVTGSLVLIQEQVALNGQPVMPEIDPDEIGEIADSHAPAAEPTQTSETPEVIEEATAEPAEERSGDPREDARLPEIDDEEGGGNTSETGGDTEELAEPTQEPASGNDDVPGELTDSSWEGAVHGHLIEWDTETWFVDIEYEGDLVSDQNAQQDLIVLQTDDASNPSLLYVIVYGDHDRTPQDYLEFWSSDEYLDTVRETGAEVEILETRTRGGSSAVLIHLTTPSGAEYLTVQQVVQLESGEVLMVTLDAPAADLMQTYESGQEVTIDGEPVFSVFSPSQLERIIEE